MAGQWKGGSPYDNGAIDCAEDLKRAGYYALVVTYRLAPCGLIKGQPPHNDPVLEEASGRTPQQTNDIKALVKAARADSHCLNKKVGIVGGSAGGSHAAFVALDKTPSNGWPNWFQNGDDRPDATVCLSGAYDLSDRTPENYPNDDDPLPRFVDDVVNYTDSFDRDHQKAVSPVSLVTYTDIKPIYLIHTQFDPMPLHQLTDMQCALQTEGVSPTAYKAWMISSSNEHSFAYWRHPIGFGYPSTLPTTVSDDAIAFLDAHLKTP